MQIIEIEALSNGAHRNQTSYGTLPEGWAVIPDGMELPNFPFGTIKTKTIEGVVTVTKWTAGEMPPTPVIPNSEKRKQAYSTGEVDGVDYHIVWNGETYTVDSLTQLGSSYRFRGEDETANSIAVAVEQEVAIIRTAFPD